MAEPRLGVVTLRVRDTAASARFYREAFGVALESGGPPRTPKEGAQAEFALVSGEEELTENAELSFFVDNVEAAHTRAVSAGAQVVQARAPTGGAAVRSTAISTGTS